MLKLLILSGLASTQKSEFLRLASQSAKVYLQNNYCTFGREERGLSE